MGREQWIKEEVRERESGRKLAFALSVQKKPALQSARLWACGSLHVGVTLNNFLALENSSLGCWCRDECT